MSEDGAPARCLVLDGPLTLRNAETLRTTLLEALLTHSSILIDCANATEVDLSFIQLLLSAQASAASLGAAVTLTAPTEGPLQTALLCAGFHTIREDLSEGRRTFWFEGAAA